MNDRQTMRQWALSVTVGVLAFVLGFLAGHNTWPIVKEVQVTTRPAEETQASKALAEFNDKYRNSIWVPCGG